MGTLENVWREHYKPLINYTKNIVKRDDLAEDIVADAFIKLYNCPNWSCPRAFLYVCCRNAAYDWLDCDKIHQEKYEEIARMEPPATNDYDQLYFFYITELYKAVLKLPVARREIFYRLFREGQTTTQIAKELKISVQTVRNQKTKAIEGLQRLLCKYSH